MVYNRYAGMVSLPGPDGKERRPFRVDERGNVIYLDKELDTVKSSGENKPVQLAETGNPAWNGYEVMRAQGQRDGQALRQTYHAADIFRKNREDMMAADTVGGDKYFHCKANSEASSQGQYGEDAAETLSDIREIYGQLKGDPVSDSIEDQQANAAGRRAGRQLRRGNVTEADHRRACVPLGLMRSTGGIDVQKGSDFLRHRRHCFSRHLL